MRELLIWSLETARKQTFLLIEDLSDKQMRRRSAAGENPPLWVLGHLLLSDTYLLSLLKVRELPANFADLLSKYGPDSKPASGNENYDSKNSLVENLMRANFLRISAVRNMENLNQPMPDETLARTQPTVGHHLQMLVFHEGHHCGQLAAWRKLQKLSAVKGIFAS